MRVGPSRIPPRQSSPITLRLAGIGTNWNSAIDGHGDEQLDRNDDGTAGTWTAISDTLATLQVTTGGGAGTWKLTIDGVDSPALGVGSRRKGWFGRMRSGANCPDEGRLSMRDRDVRNAIQAALTATGAFNAVHVWGLPEDYGSGSSEQAAAWIVPQSSRQEDLWDAAPDGGLVITSQVAIVWLTGRRPAAPRRRGRAAAGHRRQCAERPGLGGQILPQTARMPAGAGSRRNRPSGGFRRCSLINTSLKAGTITTLRHRNEGLNEMSATKAKSTGRRCRSPRPALPASRTPASARAAT